MIYLVLWVLCGLVAVAIAKNKGQPTGGAFLVGVLLGPIGILLVALTKTDTVNIETRQIADGELRRCPHCAELIRPEAKVCRYCQRDVTPLSIDPSIAKVVPGANGGYICSACNGFVRRDATECKHCHKPLVVSAAVYAQPRQD